MKEERKTESKKKRKEPDVEVSRSFMEIVAITIRADRYWNKSDPRRSTSTAARNIKQHSSHKT
jgi:hypothetical protein